ncbi:hypothetical protein Nepgr_014909 [Nepenthes gracilis]|uniref:Uncharacterized protein n=1 Tax=Nepenthes gracilis TaxID=150966 RepID=A0AAD3SKC6_NEPGR|nr:hypothetical protein Nepgr_014909 [Nepenthes gracilis]
MKAGFCSPLAFEERTCSPASIDGCAGFLPMPNPRAARLDFLNFLSLSQQLPSLSVSSFPPSSTTTDSSEYICWRFRLLWRMMLQRHVSVLLDTKVRRSCFFNVFKAACLLCLLYLIGIVFTVPRFKENTPRLVTDDSLIKSRTNRCENQCRAPGSEGLPKGIVVKTSNLEMRPLWGYPKKREKSSVSLLALAVGIKQKHLVNEMVEKFLDSGFAVMFFHYDGVVDEWKKFGWSDEVIHVSAVNQTKWWFAKRFLHPDIVAEYDYIFLWDEDLGVEHFHPERYLSIIKDEGLEISQPALDANKSEIHHQITSRGRRGNVHRRTYKHGECEADSTAPPCTGWIEVMAPVFSKAAWRCVWYMIQNDLIHAWGLDMLLGYCAQGDRTKSIGVVDAEYVIHYGLPTLGEPKDKKVSSVSRVIDKRVEVRRQSYNEYKILQKRWQEAITSDKCWVNPYPTPMKPIVLTHVQHH